MRVGRRTAVAVTSAVISRLITSPALGLYRASDATSPRRLKDGIHQFALLPTPDAPRNAAAGLLPSDPVLFAYSIGKGAAVGAVVLCVGAFNSTHGATQPLRHVAKPLS